MNTRLETPADALLTARAAHQRRDWPASYAAFTRAGEAHPLGTDDLDALALAAWRLGHVKESSRIAERVYSQLARTDPTAAAMKANELALAWFVRGDANVGQGWMNRARRLLETAPETTAHGYLAYLEVLGSALAQDLPALDVNVKALRDIGTRLDEPAVAALGLVGAGLQAMLQARIADAYGLIDEAMLSVLADQVPIEWAGDIYCVVLHHCHKVADLPRMRAWTQSMEQWCGLSRSVPYGGVCDVHRLQVRAGTDDYRVLEGLLEHASRELEEVNGWAAAEGYYQLGEVRRLLGDADGALAAFSAARSFGLDPQPGEALLRCNNGDSQAAWTAMRLALAGQDRLARIKLLRGAVEIALARDSVDEAETYCRELQTSAAAYGTPGFLAWAAHARGAVLVRRGEHLAALESLEQALSEYRVQQSRYEAAEVYEWMALARTALGDERAAEADAATADAIYRQLGVEPPRICSQPTPGRLTRREVDILTRIAAGATNKQVGSQLHISEKTVGRHLANIYAKLDVGTRTAAVTWAYTNNVIKD